MRYIKMLSLAAVAAIAAMAFVGASSAMAAESTALCKVEQVTCEAGNLVTSITMNSVKAPVLLSSLGNIECEKSGGKGAVGALAKEGAQVATVESLKWETCHRGTEKCEATTEVLGKFDIQKTGANKGTATVLETVVHVVCGFLINCKYSANGVVLTVEGAAGSSNGVLKANELDVTKLGSGICPETAKWDGEYTPTEKIFVES